MSTPTIYPPLQPGTCDIGTTYTFKILARNAYQVQLPTVNPAASGYTIQIEDSETTAPGSNGDMAVKCQVIFLGFCTTGPSQFSPSGGTSAYSATITALDNEEYEVTATQNFVSRLWTNVTTRSITYSGSLDGGAEATFTLNANGYSVGDKVLLQGTVSGSTAYYLGLVAAVTTNTFSIADALASTGMTSVTPQGSPVTWEASVSGGLEVCAYLSGQNQNDITAGAMVTGTWNEPITAFALATTGLNAVYPQGVPSGIGYSAGYLSGTPNVFGWFPVVLIAGTMQRYCLFDIAPGTYDTLIQAPITVDVGVGLTVATVITAATLSSASLINWYLAGAPSTIEIGQNLGDQAIITGNFTEVGTYPMVITAIAAGFPIIQQSITFVVSGGGSNPVVTAPGTLTLTAGAPLNYQFYATNEPTSWSATQLPPGLALGGSTGILSGTVTVPGIYQFEITATNGTGESAPVPVGLTVSAPAAAAGGVTSGSVPVYLSYLDSTPGLIDLQFDLRGRGVTSFYQNAGIIETIQCDSLTFGLVMFTPIQTEDAVTIWLVCKTVEDSSPVIDLSWTAADQLETEDGQSYYSLPIDLTASGVTEAIDDLNAPASGGPRVLAMIYQLVVQRESGQIARSLPFSWNIMQYVARANAANDVP
jgi:hypothetical protein